MNYKKNIFERVSGNIFYLRSLRGYTQTELANRTGLSSSFVAKLELNGKDGRSARLDTLEKIASTFGISVGALIDLDFEQIIERTLTNYRSNFDQIHLSTEVLHESPTHV